MKERHNPCFDFTEREKLYDKITHERFTAILAQSDVDIHEVQESTNSFGEYLFVTLSCRSEHPKKLYTFWGLGYHEYRERWVVDTWQWYESQRDKTNLPKLNKLEALAQIKEREEFARSSATSDKQSPHGELYEALADLTDEDGALTELEDLGWMVLGYDEDNQSDG